MYIPAHHAEPDRARLLRLMHDHPFATLITAPDGVPFATHLPVLVEEDGDQLTLHSHVARANPHWRHFEPESAQALVIFQGPHALVQPQWYTSRPNVPTWNYAVVHARGPIRITEGEAALTTARRLMARLTPDAPPIPAEFETKLLGGVVTFELRVTQLDGKFKLSQNKSEADQARVADQLSASADGLDRATAELMMER